MAKGRKLTTSRSERYLGSFGYGPSHGTSGTGISELGEEDVWSFVDDDPPINRVHDEWTSHAVLESNGGYVNTIRPHKRVPREDSHVGGLSLTFDDSGKKISSKVMQQFQSHDSVTPTRRRQMATSAPLKVPEWGKMLRADSIESMHDSDDWSDERESEMVPPHEYLAREYSRTGKMAATSVFEGVGRTLKGRDLRRVRDAVWSQTGFDG